jgi:isopenicillin-N epimerase
LSFKPGDEILIANTTYNAVRLSVDDVCRRFGARVRVVTLPLPMTEPQDVVGLFAAAAGPHTRIAVLDHIVSPTGFILPVAAITAALKTKGALVMIDGAHSAGQIPLNIPSIGADWYTGTLHKWMFMPKGSAYLWAARDVHAQTIPLMVSHWVVDGFPRAFDYTGTRDSTAWLCMPDALEFQLNFGADRIMAHNKALALAGARLFTKIGLEPAAAPEHFGAMQSMILSTKDSAQAEDAVILMAEMWDRHRVQIASGVVGGRLLLRVSAQVYCTLDDYARAVEALDEMGWPGRV